MRQSLKKCKFIFGVRTESWILEKVLKFAQQFSRPGKSLVNGDKEKRIFLLFLGPLLVTYFNNLESGKKNCSFGKKSWFLDPKTSLRTLILKVMFSLLSPLSMLKLPLMAEQECASLIRSRFHIQMWLLIIIYAEIRSVLDINDQ